MSPRCFLKIFENSDFFVTKYEVFSTITSRILKVELTDATYQYKFIESLPSMIFELI